MAFKTACAESGAKCPFEVITDTREELMQHIAIHAKMAHPEMKTPPPPEVMEKMIHKV